MTSNSRGHYIGTEWELKTQLKYFIQNKNKHLKICLLPSYHKTHLETSVAVYLITMLFFYTFSPILLYTITPVGPFCLCGAEGSDTPLKYMIIIMNLIVQAGTLPRSDLRRVYGLSSSFIWSHVTCTRYAQGRRGISDAYTHTHTPSEYAPHQTLSFHATATQSGAVCWASCA